MSFKTEAFVLKNIPFREADRLYTFFTSQEGIMQAVLKSAAKSSSKQAGHLPSFAKVKIMIGRGKMDHLAGAISLVIKPPPRDLAYHWAGLD